MRIKRIKKSLHFISKSYVIDSIEYVVFRSMELIDLLRIPIEGWFNVFMELLEKIRMQILFGNNTLQISHRFI